MKGSSLLDHVRRSSLVHALAVFVVLSTSLLAPTSVRACEDCWPVYYEVLYAKPSNWVTVGQYQPGDWVWKKTVNTGSQLVDTQWFVLYASDPYWFQQPDPCCSNGPWFVTEQGGLYLVW